MSTLGFKVGMDLLRTISPVLSSDSPLVLGQHGSGTFLGGLSLHLNHLIAWHVGISFRQFGTLPIGIFLSNLDSRHLMTSPRTLLGQF